MKKHFKKLLVFCLILGLLGANMISMAVEKSEESRKLSVLSVDGSEAFVIRGSSKETKAVAGVPLGQGSRVRTGEKSTLYMEMDDDKVIKLAENSSAEVSKASAKKLKITLKNGDLFFNVDKPLAADEELKIDAAQTSMSIRGTSGFLRINNGTIGVYLVEGHIEWTVGNDTVTIEPGQVAVAALGSEERLSVSDMQSPYKIQMVKSFDLRELDEFALLTLLEQMDYVDVSAIGLGSMDTKEELQTRLDEVQEELAELARQEQERLAEEERKRQEREEWLRLQENDSVDEGEEEEPDIVLPDDEIYPEDEIIPENPDDAGNVDSGESTDTSGTTDSGESTDTSGTTDTGESTDTSGTPDSGESTDTSGTPDSGESTDTSGTTDTSGSSEYQSP